MRRGAWAGAPLWTLGAALVAGSGCLTMGGQEATERIRETGPITRVDIEVDAGNIDIVGAGTGTGVNGAVVTRWGEEPPEVVHYVENGVLHVLGRCEQDAVPCLVDVTLSLPMEANVGVDTGRGDVTVRSVNGDVEVSTADGTVEAHVIGGSFFVESESGDIVGEALSGAFVDGRTRNGDVELQMTTVPQRLVARTDDGHISLIVPAGSYRIETDTPKGDYQVASGIVEDPTATSVIVAETANGDVSIDTRTPTKPSVPELPEPAVRSPE